MESLSFLKHFNVKRFITLCFKSWPIFLLTISGCLVLAAALAVIKKPKTEVTAQLILKDETSGSSMMLAGQIARSFSLGDMFGGSSSTDNELFMLKSHSVFVNTARQLDLNVSYFTRRFAFLWKNMVEDVPIHLVAPENVSDTITKTLVFKLQHCDNGNYDVNVKIKSKTIAELKDKALPVQIDTDYGNFTIEKTEYYDAATASDYKISYSSYGVAANTYSRLVDIYVPDRRSDVIGLSFVTNAPEFGKVLLSHIIDNYIDHSNLYKLQRTEHSMSLVDNRLATLADELKLSEAAIEDFKLNNKLTDPEVDAQYLLSKTGEIESSLLMAQTNYEVAKMTLDYISNPDNSYSLIPELITSSDNSASLISQYNNLILERMQLLTSVKSGNQVLTQLDHKIDALRKNIVTSVDRAYKNAKIALDELKNENSKNKLRIGELPSIERNYLVLKRDNLLQEQIYLFLLQQREELNMNLQSRSMPAQVIDQPYEAADPVGFSTKLKLVIGLFFGFLLGALYVLLRKMETAPISSAAEIKSALDMPVLQTLAKDLNAEIDVNGLNGQALRRLRSDIDQALASCSGKTVTVTSMHAAEGKTYIASNLAASLSMIGRKTLLIDMSLRDPQIAKRQHITAKDSLIDYVFKGIEPTISSIDVEGFTLWVMASTKSTPYPSDIAASEKFANLLSRLRLEYDAIIIDASSIDGYSDVYDLTPLTDITLIVCATGIITPNDINRLDDLHTQARLKRMAAVINS